MSKLKIIQYPFKNLDKIKDRNGKIYKLGTYKKWAIVIHWVAIDAPVKNVINFCDKVENVSRAQWGYSISKRGVIYQHMPEEMESWHASNSEYNEHSIGIEVVWMDDYIGGTLVEKSLIELIQDICTRHDIREVTRHHDTIKQNNEKILAGKRVGKQRFVKNCPNFFTGKNESNWVEFKKKIKL